MFNINCCLMLLFRHGVRQTRNPWADGPEYVTQCPIQPGRSYTYRFTIEDQEGTLWWHAHSRWLRATVYGALIVYPRMGSPYPFPMPKKEIPILIGKLKLIFMPCFKVIKQSIYHAMEQTTARSLTNDDTDKQGNGGTGTPWMSWGKRFSQVELQIFLMHLQLMVNQAISTDALAKVCQNFSLCRKITSNRLEIS